ncbi:MAG: hypothetical protein HKN48_12620 [Flavobacteriaceae bacterium]|nr:hypothetical protein [Flavobacteriaceae bacterium]
MKTIKSIALAIVLLVGTTLSATTNPKGDKGTAKTAEQEIEKQLEYPDFVIEESGQAYVSFYVNDNNEVVVLDVDTTDDNMESFVKERLSNYKLENKLATGQRYLLPVKIISKS